MKSPIKYLETDEVKTLFRVITDLRDRALFGLIYSYGLRVAEATLLQLSDVDFAHHTLFIRRVKGGRGGSRPLLRETATLLIQYLPHRFPTASALFTSKQGALSRRRTQQLFKEYALKAGSGRIWFTNGKGL